MDLKDQLKALFPNHEMDEKEESGKAIANIWMQEEPLLCKYEKRRGKPITIIAGYTGGADDFKILSRELKTELNVGGSVKNDTLIIQGDFRDKIMDILRCKGFNTKRVGG